MPSKLLGPDFEDFTITSENIRWLHSCRWEGAHAEAFQALRTSYTSSFGKAPNLVKSKTQVTPMISSRWLLVDEDETPHGWAELQSFPRQHHKWAVLIWGAVSDMRPDSLSLTKLVTYCFIVGKFDHITLAASRISEDAILEGFAKHLGERRETLALRESSWYPDTSAIVRFKTLELAREEWMSSPYSEDPSKALEMIRARIARFESSKRFMTPKRKKRGLMARFFNPKIDDPLF